VFDLPRFINNDNNLNNFHAFCKKKIITFLACAKDGKLDILYSKLFLFQTFCVLTKFCIPNVVVYAKLPVFQLNFVWRLLFCISSYRSHVI